MWRRSIDQAKSLSNLICTPANKHVEPVLVERWASVTDGGPALKQHWPQHVLRDQSTCPRQKGWIV